ncbi:MAG: ABC transporter ATP-binding protein [Methanomicrobiaceae archaeon]|uniref:Abc transporter, atp-binding protein n=1 Tax=hydrocarbon metagenome TaxID=938273 RepID=A0A0W8FI22_9ZZZZ|nr:ABC transporter ATP-binding protein [Methanomicrobiaceae archaeon]MDD5420022.1 ABC transporter ATP-binding protein [Methanomicrobiaceae archaeon]
MVSAICTDGLTRTFGMLTAVDGVSLDVEEGEVFGVLGPNAAGKTTLIRLINGVLTPTRGKASVYGKDAAREGTAVRAMTGVLTESPSHYERLTGRQNLTFYARLYGLPEPDVAGSVAGRLTLFGLEARADDLVGGYSKGMKQRLALARALIHDPKVLFLDEPTAGLDPEASRQVNDMIRGLAESGGRTVFLCTHNLHEAQSLCDRVAMLNQGRILATGSIRELSEQLWQATPVEIEFLTPPPEAVLTHLSAMQGVTLIDRGDVSLTLRVSQKEVVPAVVASAVANSGRVLRVSPREYSLEEIYFAIQRGREAAE